MALRHTLPLYPRLDDTCPPACGHNAVIRNRLLINKRIHADGNPVSNRLPADHLRARSQKKALSQFWKWAVIDTADGDTL